jgi:hypothetical protein
MKLFTRPMVAMLLTVIYTLIIMSPLAPLAMKSPRIAHAITGECAGDCDTCGCSAERRANHTCCCWQKKLKHGHDLARAQFPDCCKKKQRHRMTMLTCNCPCGSNDAPGLPGTENSELMPYRFNEGVIALDEDVLFSSHGDLFKDRHVDPPDPPPKLAILS